MNSGTYILYQLFPLSNNSHMKTLKLNTILSVLLQTQNLMLLSIYHYVSFTITRNKCSCF